jgi:hypothetical protein
MKAMIHSKMIDTLFTVATVSLDQWASQMVTVLETKKFGVAFCLAANFRDLFIKHYNFFPLFGGFGQRQRKVRIWFLPAGFLYHNLNPLS